MYVCVCVRVCVCACVCVVAAEIKERQQRDVWSRQQLVLSFLYTHFIMAFSKPNYP